MSRFRIPGGVGYQGQYPQGDINDGTQVRTKSSAPATFSGAVESAWNELSYETRSKLASAGVDVRRMVAVGKAVRMARLKVAPMLVAELGVRVDELLSAVLPGLLVILCCVVGTTALGAAAGGALGFFLGGVGSVPGAVIGAGLGLDAGIALLTWLGLAFLLAHIGKDLVTALQKAHDGLCTAWNAGDLSSSALDLRIDFAATQLADAAVHLYLAIVNGLIAYVTKGSLNSSVNSAKATIAATKTEGAAAVSAQQLADAIAQLNKTKVLGKTVATWFEKNYEAIIEFRRRKAARPPETTKPPEPTMSPSQLKKAKEEQEALDGNVAGNSSGSVGANSGRVADSIVVTSRGVAVTPDVLALKGSSKLVGDFRGLQGAKVDEIISRVPSNWSLASQEKGFGVRFLDEIGVERLRLHGPSGNAPVGSNSASGWTMRVHVPGTKNSYFDNLGNVVGSKSNAGHIPIYDNPKAGF